MGFVITDNKVLNIHRKPKNETHVKKVALWQLPYDSRYADFDTDKTSWFESDNRFHTNEIKNAERVLKINLKPYEVHTQKIEYNDKSVTELSKYPNGNTVKVNKTSDYVSVEVRHRKGRVAAQKYYNYSSDEGRKLVYKNIAQGGDIFTVVRVFSYNTKKNKSTDVINYGYTSQMSNFIGESTFETEYYMLNGEEVKAELKDNKYVIKNAQGETLTFAAE